MATPQLSKHPWVETHHKTGTQRARGISKMNNSMTERIHKMFDLGHIVNHFTYRDKVQILYLDLNLSRLSFSEKDAKELFVEIGEVGSEAHEYILVKIFLFFFCITYFL